MAEPVADEDLTIPRAAMNKMIKELLPQIRVANEARELILNCCTEFIHLISSEANEICNKQQKKTINAEHVLSGMQGIYISSWQLNKNTLLRSAITYKAPCLYYSYCTGTRNCTVAGRLLNLIFGLTLC